jgi:hypothetical protein
MYPCRSTKKQKPIKMSLLYFKCPRCEKVIKLNNKSVDSYEMTYNIDGKLNDGQFLLGLKITCKCGCVHDDTVIKFNRYEWGVECY